MVCSFSTTNVFYITPGNFCTWQTTVFCSMTSHLCSSSNRKISTQVLACYTTYSNLVNSVSLNKLPHSKIEFNFLSTSKIFMDLTLPERKWMRRYIGLQWKSHTTTLRRNGNEFHPNTQYSCTISTKSISALLPWTILTPLTITGETWPGKHKPLFILVGIIESHMHNTFWSECTVTAHSPWPGCDGKPQSVWNLVIIYFTMKCQKHFAAQDPHCGQDWKKHTSGP